MNDTLDSAHAWFFESASHFLDGRLVIRIVEGIKGTERQFVEVSGTKLGPYFPVKVEAQSRIAEITFANALVYFGYDESYDTAEPDLKKGAGRFLFNAEASSFRKFAEKRTTVAKLHEEPYLEFLLCCEDRIFHVLSSEEPVVVVLQANPDLTVERTNTWSAN
jgi:hypothetical protein